MHKRDFSIAACLAVIVGFVAVITIGILVVLRLEKPQSALEVPVDRELVELSDSR